MPSQIHYFLDRQLPEDFMQIGIVGSCSLQPERRGYVDRMYALLNNVSAATRVDTALGSVGFISLRVASWIRPNTAATNIGDLLVVIVGEVRQGGRTLDADAVAKRWQTDGEECLTQFGGSFAVITWHQKSHDLCIASDRLGMEKIFYRKAGESILFASELAPIRCQAPASEAINAYAVAEFLTASHMISSRSLVEGIEVVPPASTLTWKDGQLVKKKYWRPRAGNGPHGSVDDWAERLRSVLSEVIAKRCGDQELLLPLSGGLDSRCVASFIPSLSRARTRACSFGPSACNDLRYGRALARALGIPHKRLRLPSAFFREDLPLGQRLTDGEISIEALPMLQLRHEACPSRVMLHGFLGDVLSGGHLLPADSAAQGFAGFDLLWQKQYVKMGFSESLLTSVLVPERSHVVGAMRQDVAEALANADAEHFEERAMLIELEHRQARYVSYMHRAMSAYGPAWSCFLEPEVLDAFLELPLAHRRGQHAYRRMIRMQSPSLAAVPEATTELPMADIGAPAKARKASRFAETPFIWRVQRLGSNLERMAERVAGGWVSRRRRGHYVQLEDLARITDPEWFRSRLADSRLVEDWFQPAALLKMFDEHMGRHANHAVRLNNVVAFLEWRSGSGL